MVELGNPFSRPYRELIESLERSIREGVLQIDQEKLIFQSSVRSYPLKRNAFQITSVTGIVENGGFMQFQRNVHYRYQQDNNTITWLNDTEKPADGGRLTVEYSYREPPSGLTDFNPGSVAGMLVRSISREMTLIYEQIDQAYRRAFIDYAEGAALDNVVALLGLGRNPAQPAEGFVTFFRKTVPSQSYTIPTETVVADELGHSFATSDVGRISVDPIDEILQAEADVITTTNMIGELIGVWLVDDDPDTDPAIATSDDYGEDGNAISPDGAPFPAATDLRVRYIARSVTIPVVATVPGPESNVNAMTVTIMPTPPSGVDGVFNDEPMVGGLVPESDEQLRERAKFHLERLGNATRNAIRYAVLELDGVEGVEVLDHTVDNTIPLGEVRVNYSGGDPYEVQRVVDETRAAGILPRLTEIEQVLVVGTFYVIPEESVPVSAVDNFLQEVFDSISELEIGKPLSVRRLNALVYNVPGLAEVAEFQDEGGDLLPEPLLIERTQLLRPDEANLAVVLLTSLLVNDTRRVVDATEVDFRINSSQGPVTFNAFTLNVRIDVYAQLSTAPDQPRDFIGSVTPLPEITFTASNTATLIIADGDTGYNPADHDPNIEIVVSAAIYPGIASVSTIVDLS